jgi:trehalose 6-phosphate synthase
VTVSGSDDLVVVSNRGPFSLVAGLDGALTPQAGGGGLAPSLAAALGRTTGAVWVAAAMSDADRQGAAAGEIESGQAGLSLRLLAFEPGVLEGAYDVIANATLWFVYHGLYDSARRPVFDGRWWEAWEEFRVYNRSFAEAVAEAAATDAVVLVNDYHLPLMGSMLAAERPDLRTVHFSHTPFASPQELAMLPRVAARELLEGMAGFGACGFHCARWEEAFRRCAEGADDLRVPETFVAPLGPDLARLEQVARSPECAERLSLLSEHVGGRRLVLRSDRIELSKNLLRGLWAYDALLSEHPEWRGAVVHVVRAYASREGLPEYLAYRSEVEHLAAVLNERWSEGAHEPVMLDVDDDFASTVAALQSYDVLLVNPTRDGMNLVAKEGPALNRRDGMLVLSEQAGAFDELGGEAFGINPFDVSETARALHEALSMPATTRAERASRLRSLAVAHPPAEWLTTVLAQARVPGGQRP